MRKINPLLAVTHCYYKTTLVASKDGSCTKGQAYVTDKLSWRWIGDTKWMHTYPSGVRARAAARGLCVRHFRTRVARDTEERGYKLHIDEQ